MKNHYSAGEMRREANRQEAMAAGHGDAFVSEAARRARMLRAGADAMDELARMVEGAPACEWTSELGDGGTYKTGCGNAFAFDGGGTASENDQKYCGFCGRLIVADDAAGDVREPGEAEQADGLVVRDRLIAECANVAFKQLVTGGPTAYCDAGKLVEFVEAVMAERAKGAK